MPSKSEKQRKVFGAVTGAKKGKGKVSGAAKKVAKDMPEKEIKKFLKKEEDAESISKKVKTVAAAMIAIFQAVTPLREWLESKKHVVVPTPEPEPVLE